MIENWFCDGKSIVLLFEKKNLFLKISYFFQRGLNKFCTTSFCLFKRHLIFKCVFFSFLVTELVKNFMSNTGTRISIDLRYLRYLFILFSFSCRSWKSCFSTVKKNRYTPQLQMNKHIITRNANIDSIKTYRRNCHYVFIYTL